MSRWARYVIGLALALPMGGYVAGSLMASAEDDPGNRDPVRISDQPGSPHTDDDPRKPERPERPAEPPAKEPVEAPSAPDDDADDDAEDDVDDNGVRVVTPQPTRLDDGNDDDGGGGAADDDGDDDDDRESRDRSRDDSD